MILFIVELFANIECSVFYIKCIVKILVNIHNKKHGKIIELSIISHYDIIKQRPIFFFKLSPYLVK